MKLALSASIKCAVDLAQEKGASSWLTAVPLEELVSHSTRALMVSLECPYPHFTVEHSPKAASLPSDIMRSVTLLGVGCLKFAVTFVLSLPCNQSQAKPSAITEDEARLDIAANGFWDILNNYVTIWLHVRTDDLQYVCHARYFCLLDTQRGQGFEPKLGLVGVGVRNKACKTAVPRAP